MLLISFVSPQVLRRKVDFVFPKWNDPSQIAPLDSNYFSHDWNDDKLRLEGLFN